MARAAAASHAYRPPLPPATTSAVPVARTTLRGRQPHAAAVQRLLESYRSIPANQPVRLAKRTSNLFRPRGALTAGGRSGPAGLDVTGLDGVISVDVEARTAEVQGMCTYETLVAATLPRGLMPTVVPQLKTITLGGAVTGLGIESTSFRNGLPHEAVRELDVLTGAGELVTARPDGAHADLYRGFPNSYGSLGYAVRLVIDLQPVEQPVVALRNVRFGSLAEVAAACEAITAEQAWAGEPVHFLDGVVFAPDEAYLVLGRWAEVEEGGALSDYTGQSIYYRSLRERSSDALTIHDYLWRWDPDWFWCSGAFGAQHPRLRRVWPAQWRRSDVYHRLVGLEHRFGVAARLDRLRGRPPRERVIQDVEIPVAELPGFLDWLLANVELRPVWLCPVKTIGGPWPLYPLEAGQTYVNAGFWGTVPIRPGRADGDVNRLVERAVADAHGHKSLYSDVYYDEAEFWSHYGGAVYPGLKQRYDPEHRLADLYAKVTKQV